MVFNVLPIPIVDYQHLEISKNGMDENHHYRQCYKCKNCNRRFDDLTDTIFLGSSKELKTWLICTYLMGLDISNSQIAQKLYCKWLNCCRLSVHCLIVISLIINYLNNSHKN